MEDKEAEILKAHAYENDLLPAAEAEAERLRLAAEAYKKHRVLVSRAEAQRFQGQLAAYNRAPDVFRARELHSAMEEAFADSRKIILADWMESDEVMILDLEDKMLPGFELDLE
jgi:membrane protease subunit HflK